jgi:hypothetical protein
MTAAAAQDREIQAAEYLHSLRAMTAELERAMRAIASNSLAELEESLDTQQVLSGRLAKLADGLCVPLHQQPAIAEAAVDPGLQAQIQIANATLQLLNRRYAALLQHSSRSLAQMASVLSSFHGQFQEASGPRLKHQTWSCQM